MTKTAIAWAAGLAAGAAGLIAIIGFAAHKSDPCAGLPRNCKTQGGQRGNTVLMGFALRAGKSLCSCDGRYRLTMQQDGNLVLYRTSDGAPLWATMTRAGDVSGGPGVKATLQGYNGALAVYNAAGASLWSTETRGGKGAASLALQDDGNLVLYDGNGAPLWATGTAGQ